MAIRLRSMSQTSDAEIACFDVFDTVLTRAVGQPRSVFVLLGQRLTRTGAISCSPEVFARLRMQAEIIARTHAPAGEVRLEEIYRELAAILPGEHASPNALAEAECEIERTLVRPVPSTARRIAAERAAGKRIVFASDMYHSPTFVRQLLLSAGVLQEGDGVFVSGYAGASKASGKLFHFIAADYGVPLSALSHYGDHPQSDVAVPKALGVRAQRAGDCDPSRYETILERHTFSTGGLAALFAGASRLTRQHFTDVIPCDLPIVNVAAGVVGPFLVAYIAWVLRRATVLGVDRLYFVSRDGQIMLDVAKRLAPAMDFPGQLRYLYGSRQAWHLPAITSIGPHELSWIFEKADFVSVESILDRLCIAPREIEPSLTAAGIPARDWRQALTPERQRILHDLLASRSVLSQMVLDKAASARATVQQYLEQEELLSKGSSAIVDIGWRGRLQRSLDRIIKAGGGSPPRGFYVGLQRDSPRSEADRYEAFMFDSPQAGGWGLVPPGAAFVTEMFCQATHGLVTGYQAAGQRIIPTMNEKATPERVAWGVNLVHEVVRRYVDNVFHDADLLQSSQCMKQSLYDLFTEFWDRPTSAEVARWGTFPYETTQTGDRQQQIAQPLSVADVAAFAVTGQEPVSLQYWRAATLARSPAIVRTAFAIARRSHTWVRPVRRRLKTILTRP